MKGADELLTIAELAVGLAGFAGVVVAFTRRGKLKGAERHRFANLFSQALFGTALCFVPFAFHHAGQVGPALWSASSGVMVVLWVCGALWRGSHPPDISSEEMPPRAFIVALVGLPIFNLLLQIANFVGWPMESGVLSYMLGLLIWISFPALQFAILILYRAEE